MEVALEVRSSGSHSLQLWHAPSSLHQRSAPHAASSALPQPQPPTTSRSAACVMVCSPSSTASSLATASSSPFDIQTTAAQHSSTSTICVRKPSSSPSWLSVW